MNFRMATPLNEFYKGVDYKSNKLNALTMINSDVIKII